MGRRLSVSDIHGEGHRLLQVLEKAKYEAGNDRLFLLGDYFDRGLNSKETFYIVQDLQKGGAVVLVGNHEQIALNARKSNDHRNYWLQKGGNTTLMEWYTYFLPDSVEEWIRTLPLYHEEPDCILVHAGLKPGIPLAEQNRRDLIWIRGVFHNGYRGKRVVFGHTPVWKIHGDRGNLGVWYGPDKVGIDTGAAYGGRLTLLDIDSGETWWA